MCVCVCVSAGNSGTGPVVMGIAPRKSYPRIIPNSKADYILVLDQTAFQTPLGSERLTHPQYTPFQKAPKHL